MKADRCLTQSGVLRSRLMVVSSALALPRGRLEQTGNIKHARLLTPPLHRTTTTALSRCSRPGRPSSSRSLVQHVHLSSARETKATHARCVTLFYYTLGQRVLRQVSLGLGGGGVRRRADGQDQARLLHGEFPERRYSGRRGEPRAGGTEGEETRERCVLLCAYVE